MLAGVRVREPFHELFLSTAVLSPVPAQNDLSIVC